MKNKIILYSTMILLSAAVVPSGIVFAEATNNDNVISTNVIQEKVTLSQDLDEFRKEIGVSTEVVNGVEITTITDDQVKQILLHEGLIDEKDALAFSSPTIASAPGVNRIIRHGNGVVDYQISKSSLIWCLRAGATAATVISVLGTGAVAVAGGIASLIASWSEGYIAHGKTFRFYNNRYKATFNQF
ncbi:hypothetical protein [Vagococcus silagei]|uniref:Uncharacterized protein n=1 Tax=Vagococcus silagei TaxID=2508885 RepID=A0A4S3B4N6_9ENTE|nr:hypothetical protein [Vagococcus silagei]THB60573.1 hypothetical protein ESZ54_09525 [Vagococcus silagei]